ncbi:c4-dicarboxylate transporter malic acid transporter [Phlyctema vagabunda]|uniref:C4-dicarboxylate transporter malic acid transporter n=1 Tax=Phlyctema vagabunda TaxID=108571 RepID=A0ABR4PB48_9HELO
MSISRPLPGQLNQASSNSGCHSPPYADLEEGLSRDAVNHQDRLKRKFIGNEGTGLRSTGNTIPNETTATEKQDGQRNGVKRYSYRDRLGCYTWTFFTLTMATGGMANVLHSIPFRPRWLRIIGATIMLFNIGLFLLNCTFLALRFRWNPGSFRASFTRPKESLFVPASVVSAGTILINICQYGIPNTGVWLQTTMQILFWVYAGIAFIASATIYLIIWSTQAFPVHTMTPIWIFPAYPLLLLAPFAANLIDAIPDATAAARISSLSIAFGAVTIQGTGFLISLMIYGAFIYRLMTQKLPRGGARPGMFVSVGPSGFTVAGIVLLGDTLPKIMPDGYRGHPDAPFFLQLLAFMVGLWLWGLCVWFFVVSVGAHHKFARPDRPKYRLDFDMTWFSFVFPNTALVTATQAIAKAFDSYAMKIVATTMSGLLVVVWLSVLGMMVKSFCCKELLWPEEDEA